LFWKRKQGWNEEIISKKYNQQQNNL